MDIEPIFPPELEREIFETTAILHPKTIPTLLRVAHRILIWVEPLLYRVILSDESMDALRRAMHVKPASFFAASVRHLAFPGRRISSELPAEEIRALLQLCTNIVSLALNMDTPGLLPIMQEMKIRRWVGWLVFFFEGNSDAVDLSHPAFRTVTHLHTFDDLRDDAEVPRLVLERCTRLQVLLVFWDIPEPARQMAANPPVTDVRFVVCIHGGVYRKDWEVGARGGTDMWTAADTFVARKRRREIDTSCYLLEHLVDYPRPSQRGSLRWSHRSRRQTAWCALFHSKFTGQSCLCLVPDFRESLSL
ncbi:hypothetical protein DFH07DRAFT_546282 [Mycena maculata]|uniref:Uncharacterized protein n=1 Tax=Mycena maculata TaxID=230809 RepID=A0AAD7N8I3_9AGAR|nr:hypothetical protein DFH07DRAFT_546282 [Mycena maculata]